MFSLGLFLAFGMWLTYSKGLETCCVTNNQEGQILNRLTDAEYRLKQVEKILDKFVSVEITWKNDQPNCVSAAATVAPTTVAPTTTNPSLCPAGWKKFQKSCYFFNIEGNDFTTAARLCKSWSSHLVYVDNAEENKFIFDYIKTNLTAATWWLGLTDSEKEGTWKWVGTDRVATFTFWDTPYPDNSGGNENCAAYTNPYGFKWNDAPCYLKYYSICEKELA